MASDGSGFIIEMGGLYNRGRVASDGSGFIRGGVACDGSGFIIGGGLPLMGVAL